MEYLEQLEQIIEKGHRLITIDTNAVDRVCDLLLELSRFSTKPYYMAQPIQAMYRFGFSHMSIPRTQVVNSLVEHIENSKHFGIFILRDYLGILDDDEIVKKLIKIATADTHKIIIMVAENTDSPKKLGGGGDRVACGVIGK